MCLVVSSQEEEGWLRTSRLSLSFPNVQIMSHSLHLPCNRMVKCVERCQYLYHSCFFNNVGDTRIIVNDIKELDSLGINVLDIAEEKLGQSQITPRSLTWVI